MTEPTRAEKIRHLIKVADDLRRQAKDSEYAAQMLTCGLDVKAGTYTYSHRSRTLMAAALREDAAALYAEAETFDAQI